MEGPFTIPTARAIADAKAGPAKRRRVDADHEPIGHTEDTHTERCHTEDTSSCAAGAAGLAVPDDANATGISAARIAAKALHTLPALPQAQYSVAALVGVAFEQVVAVPPGDPAVLFSAEACDCVIVAVGLTCSALVLSPSPPLHASNRPRSLAQLRPSFNTDQLPPPSFHTHTPSQVRSSDGTRIMVRNGSFSLSLPLSLSPSLPLPLSHTHPSLLKLARAFVLRDPTLPIPPIATTRGMRFPTSRRTLPGDTRSNRRVTRCWDMCARASSSSSSPPCAGTQAAGPWCALSRT